LFDLLFINNLIFWH